VRAGSERGTRAAIVAVGLVAAVVAAVVLVGRLESRPVVVLAGDSITEQGAGALAGAIDGTFGIGGHDVAVVARSGATAGEMEPEVVAAAAAGPEQVIINLGTNDAVRTGTVPDGLAAVERMAASFPTATCIHLVTLSESVVAFEDPVGPGQRAAEMNKGLIDLAQRNGYRLIRWDQIAAEGVARGEPLTVDSIHPDGAGQARLAEAYRDAVEAC
jgi:lysophospholipase L1-like esterase